MCYKFFKFQPSTALHSSVKKSKLIFFSFWSFGFICCNIKSFCKCVTAEYEPNVNNEVSGRYELYELTDLLGALFGFLFISLALCLGRFITL